MTGWPLESAGRVPMEEIGRALRTAALQKRTILVMTNLAGLADYGNGDFAGVVGSNGRGDYGSPMYGDGSIDVPVLNPPRLDWFDPVLFSQVFGQNQGSDPSLLISKTAGVIIYTILPTWLAADWATTESQDSNSVLIGVGAAQAGAWAIISADLKPIANSTTTVTLILNAVSQHFSNLTPPVGGQQDYTPYGFDYIRSANQINWDPTHENPPPLSMTIGGFHLFSPRNWLDLPAITPISFLPVITNPDRSYGNQGQPGNYFDGFGAPLVNEVYDPSLQSAKLGTPTCSLTMFAKIPGLITLHETFGGTRVKPAFYSQVTPCPAHSIPAPTNADWFTATNPHHMIFWWGNQTPPAGNFDAADPALGLFQITN